MSSIRSGLTGAALLEGVEQPKIRMPTEVRETICRIRRRFLIGSLCLLDAAGASSDGLEHSLPRCPDWMLASAKDRVRLASIGRRSNRSEPGSRLIDHLQRHRQIHGGKPLWPGDSRVLLTSARARPAKRVRVSCRRRLRRFGRKSARIGRAKEFGLNVTCRRSYARDGLNG